MDTVPEEDKSIFHHKSRKHVHCKRITSCIRLTENAMKMFFRWYVIPEKIVCMANLKIQDRCWKCGKERGTFFHMWWLCSKVKKYWDSICMEMGKNFKYNLRKTPELVLLGL